MRKNIEQDERVLAQKRKIGSDAFTIVWIGLLISVLIQQYILNAPFIQYAVEIMLFIVASIYVVVRNVVGGNDLFGTKKDGQTIVAINSAVCGFTVTCINTILNYTKYSVKVQGHNMVYLVMVAGITFVCATVTAYIALELLYLANKKKQKQIEEELDHDEEL